MSTVAALRTALETVVVIFIDENGGKTSPLDQFFRQAIPEFRSASHGDSRRSAAMTELSQGMVS